MCDINNGNQLRMNYSLDILYDLWGIKKKYLEINGKIRQLGMWIVNTKHAYL